MAKYDLDKHTTDNLIGALNEYNCLYEVNGVWKFRIDIINQPYLNQDNGETLREFVIRCIEWVYENDRDDFDCITDYLRQVKSNQNDNT